MPELPEDNRNMMVMICIDRLSKIVQLVLLQEFNAQSTANKFPIMVVSHHSLLECIIRDHDPRLHGKIFGKSISLLDTTLMFSTALYYKTNKKSKL